jgi:hypothetical protein
MLRIPGTLKSVGAASGSKGALCGCEDRRGFMPDSVEFSVDRRITAHSADGIICPALRV